MEHFATFRVESCNLARASALRNILLLARVHGVHLRLRLSYHPVSHFISAVQSRPARNKLDLSVTLSWACFRARWVFGIVIDDASTANNCWFTVPSPFSESCPFQLRPRRRLQVVQNLSHNSIKQKFIKPCVITCVGGAVAYLSCCSSSADWSGW